MSGPVEAIRSKVNSNCLVENCTKEKCIVDLNGSPTSRVIVDFDAPGSPLASHDTRCDYLFVADGRNGAPGWVAPMELTTGRSKSASKAIAQLRAGAEIAAEYIAASVSVNFRPVFVGRANRFLQKELKKKSNEINFHGKKVPAYLINCGDQLSKVLT